MPDVNTDSLNCGNNFTNSPPNSSGPIHQSQVLNSSFGSYLKKGTKVQKSLGHNRSSSRLPGDVGRISNQNSAPKTGSANKERPRIRRQASGQNTPSSGGRLGTAFAHGVLVGYFGAKGGMIAAGGAGAVAIPVAGAVPGAIVGAIGGGILGFAVGFAACMLWSKPGSGNPERQAVRSDKNEGQADRSENPDQRARLTRDNLNQQVRASSSSRRAEEDDISDTRSVTSREMSPSVPSPNNHYPSIGSVEDLQDSLTPSPNLKDHEVSRRYSVEPLPKLSSEEKERLDAMQKETRQLKRQAYVWNGQYDHHPIDYSKLGERDPLDLYQILQLSERVKSQAQEHDQDHSVDSEDTGRVDQDRTQLQQRAANRTLRLFNNFHFSIQPSDGSQLSASDAEELATDFADMVFSTMLYSTDLDGAFSQAKFDEVFQQMLAQQKPHQIQNREQLLRSGGAAHVLSTAVRQMNDRLKNNGPNPMVDENAMRLMQTACDHLLNSLGGDIHDSDSASGDAMKWSPSVPDQSQRLAHSDGPVSSAVRGLVAEVPKLTVALNHLPAKEKN